MRIISTTLNELIDQVSQRASIDRQNQTNITLLTQWVNITIRDISTRHRWPWLNKRTAITTVADSAVTDDTTTATNGSKTVTSTGTPFAATDVGRFIQFEDTNDWYEITARASSSSISIEPAFQGTTATDLDHTIRTLYYNLPANCHKVYDVRQYRTPAKLTYIDTKTLDLLKPHQTTTGTPRSYYLFYYSNPQSSTGQQWAVSFEPVPDAAMLVEVRYYAKPTLLSLGTDISEIPEIYHNVILDGASYQAFLWANNPSTGGMKNQYEAGIQYMKWDALPTTDDFDVIQAIDEVSKPSRIVPFPEEFGWL